jgi:outer membrane murein-binding lipoprotein Lpp
MKSKSIVSIIAAVLVSLVAGCASVGAPDDLFTESKTYNGGE